MVIQFSLMYQVIYQEILQNELNPPALESFKSVDISLLNEFHTFVFCLVVSNNSCGKSFSANIFKFILRVVPVLSLTANFNFFSCVSDNLTFTLLYSTIYINCETFVVPFANSSIVSFDCSRM